MENIKKSASEIIGNTPLLEISRYAAKSGIKNVRLLAKMEGLNPAGSAKDRVALVMIEEAEKKGRLKPGAAIIEPTSGNTGIGLAAVAAAKGYHAILTLPETMSVERQTMLKAYGAEIVLTEGAKGMKGAIEKAEELHREMEGSIILGQFENPDNPKAHYESTGPEIYRDTDGKVDVFIASVGTGGTITGTGRFLKEKNPAIKVIAVEPDTSAVLSGDQPGSHEIQGIGAGFIPKTLDTGIYDEVIRVPNEVCYTEGRAFAATEGVLVGISSGAVLWAAKQVAEREDYKGKTIVVLLPDSGDRYLSTKLYMD